MASVNSYYFTGTNGDAWDASKFNFVSGGCDIQSNMGRHISKAGAFNNEQLFFKNPGSSTDMLVTFDVINIDGLTCYFNYGFQSGQVWGGEHYWSTGSVGSHGGGSASFSVTIGDTLHYKFRMSGANFKMRIWKNADPEPSTWLIDVTTTVPSGANEILIQPRTDASATQVTMYFDNWNISNDPDSPGISLVGTGFDYAGVGADGFTSQAYDTSGADFIAVAMGYETTGSGLGFTDSKGNSWTPKTPAIATTTGVRWYYAYDAIVGTGHTFAPAGTDTFPGISVAYFAGVKKGSDPFHSENGGTQVFGSTVQPGSVTPPEPGCLVLTAFTCTAPSGGLTVDSPFTKYGHITDGSFGHDNTAAGYDIQTTATARNPTWDFGSSATLQAVIAVFRPEIAAGGSILIPVLGRHTPGTVQARNVRGY